jgi:hypothetical protein
VVIWGLGDTNRSAFDFAEGESELVSGCTIEYKDGHDHFACSIERKNWDSWQRSSVNISNSY